MSKKSTLSNSAAMGIVSDEDIRSQAKLAFKDNNQSQALAGSAVQRLAFAVTAEHHAMNQAGKKLGSLASVLNSPETLKAVRDAMSEFFIGDAPDAAEGKSDASETARASRVAQVQLLSRALQLAGILAHSHVGLAEFNRTTGNYTVPTKLLLATGETAFGRLAAAQSIALDGKPILVHGKNKKGDDTILTLRASVSRLLQVNAPAKARGTKKGGGDATFKDHLAAVASALMSDKDPVHLGDLGVELKDHLAAIVDWYRLQEVAEANARQADLAKGAAKRAEQAQAEKPKQAAA